MPAGDSGIVFQGRRFRVERVVRIAPDGHERAWDVLRHPGSAVILPLLDDGRVCLVRNYRVAIGRPLLELPAGTLEPDEDPLEAAARELAEETGYRAGRIVYLISLYPSPGILDEHMRLYVAQDLTPGPLSLDPGEELHPLLLTWPEALEMIRTGEIQDGKTVAGLLYWRTFRAVP